MVSLVAIGCGGSGDETSQEEPTAGRAVDLTRWLPAGWDYYESVDVAALKRGLRLAGGADPLHDREMIGFTNSLLGGLFSAYPPGRVIDALDMPAVTALAFADDRGSAPITVMRTAADPADIRADLLSLGFVDHDGVLEGPDEKRAAGVPSFENEVEVLSPDEERRPDRFPGGALAVRAIDDILFLSADADALRDLPATPGDLPLDVQTMLDGDATWALRPYECLLGSGVAMNADGSGRLVYIVDGRPDAKAFSALTTDQLADPEIDGNVLTVAVDVDRPLSPQDFLSEHLPGYGCLAG